MDATNLIVYLPFDESTTKDLCGNSWTAYGSLNVSGGKLQLTGNGDQNYLECTAVALGGRDFTIGAKVYADSASHNYARFFALFQSTAQTKTRINAESAYFEFNGSRAGSMTKGALHHVEIDYQHSAGLMTCFVDGVKVATKNITYAENVLDKIWIGRSEYSGYSTLQGFIENFMIWDGVALHTDNFTPPTDDDYTALKLALAGNFTVDVERKISNRVEVKADVERRFLFRYFNPGDADDLITENFCASDYDADQSRTGSAFYQTVREKCFDLPATQEIWIKFDVYFDGSNRWRAYNGGSNGNTGICSYVNFSAVFGTWCNDVKIKDFTGTVVKNQLQTFLLHMHSHSSAGIVESWVDGTLIYSYTGDVNHGEDFADIYLQSDGAGTVFSNVVISNKRLTFGDGFNSISFDTERRIKNRAEFPVDVERNVILPIVVPFIGEHFNHYVSSLKLFRDKAQRIILPKKSTVYVHADGGNSLKIFSDTDADGKKTGEIYAQLGECETVFIEVIDSPLRVIKDFMHSLDETTLTGDAALDEAINYCTGGIFDSRSAVAEKFINDLNGSASYEDFLQNYCDINLLNADTGAITGLDAGGGGEKTSKSIVPEHVPVEDWIEPALGSTKTIRGLSVKFPASGASGALTDIEKHILAGLNSVWIEQALILIQESFGLDFNEAEASVKNISVQFENDSTNGALAYVSYTASNGKTTSLTFTINMYYYNGVNFSSEDGASSGASLYLDRTIAHEFTHAVMVANIDNFSSLPEFIAEGAAELVHGIDDMRRSNIIKLVTTKKDTLGDIISGVATGAVTKDFYSAGYLFLRYLAKQGQNTFSVPNESIITNLFIGDGEDTTRKDFSADVAREVIKSFELNLDVEILDVVPVDFNADINRAILAKIFLFPIFRGDS